MRTQENRHQVNDQVRNEAPQLNIERNTFSVGPFRLSFGVRQGFVRDAININRANLRVSARAGMELPQRLNSSERSRQASSVHAQVASNMPLSSHQGQLLQLEQQILREIQSLGAHATQLFLVRLLEAELVRLRVERNDESLAAAERLNLFQPFAMDSLQQQQLLTPTQIFPSDLEEQNLAATQRGVPNGLITPHGWNVVLLRRLQDDGDFASAISALPLLNNISSGYSSTQPIVQPIFSSQPSILNSRTVKHPNKSAETEADIKQNTTDLLALDNLADLSHSFPDKPDEEVPLVRLWNEAEAGTEKNERDYSSYSLKKRIDHSPNDVHTQTTSESMLIIDRSSETDAQIESTDRLI